MLVEHPQFQREWIELGLLRLLWRNLCLVIVFHGWVEPFVSAQVRELVLVRLLQLEQVHLVPLLVEVLLVRLVYADDSLLVHAPQDLNELVLLAH